MRLTVRLLGLDLLDVELTTDQPDDGDYSRDLSGGNLGSDCIDAGETDWHLGFTNGREAE